MSVLPATSSRTRSFQWMLLWRPLKECMASAGTSSGHSASTGMVRSPLQRS